jgi:hypothetical protein
MANNRFIPRLSDLAFQAFLKNSVIPTVSQAQNEVYLQAQFNHFLQSIVDVNVAVINDFLEDNPEIAVLRGTVTTASGYTYRNVSAIELACVMGNVNLLETVLFPVLKQQSQDLFEKAQKQLGNKIAEIEKLRIQFKPYNFSDIVNAITADQTLRNTGQPNETTTKALIKLKADFAPRIISEGKSSEPGVICGTSWIEEQLIEAYAIIENNLIHWSEHQYNFYINHIINYFLQNHVEKNFEIEIQRCADETLNELRARGHNCLY